MPRVNPKMLGEPRVEVSRIEEVERMESQHAGPELGEPGDARKIGCPLVGVCLIK
jgi:hypothetical protein